MPVDFRIDDRWVRSHRGARNKVDPGKPYAFIAEKERGNNGEIQEVVTIFLTNRECPFQCLMCDLWKNTTVKSVSAGDIPRQIEWALERLPTATTIKLYNSGNFFDINAIPVSDYPDIAALLSGFDSVIIENHPRLINSHTFKFRELLATELEIAMGLETANPEVLKRLNKKMTLEDFISAVALLGEHQIATRAFLLLRPPFLDEAEGILWAQRSIQFAFDAGVRTAVVIPTRYGNGALDKLGQLGYFSPPDIKSLEQVLEYGISLAAGNVFADLWDIELFSKCSKCIEQRKQRMHQMNLYQQVLPEVSCDC
jgi:radical SAM enzyme (TIGR01210 family)